MDYFHILNLEREPFSNSPDPAYFYHSRQHLECLQKIELSLRLRRGLNVVTGEVGTGKTTLCRQLIQRFTAEDDIETHLVLDPDFPDADDFLAAIAGMICSGSSTVSVEGPIKERIKAALFEKGVERDKTVVLIIDEGQKIPAVCLEILRELLNYETNEAKLLQIVIFAQTEFDRTLSAQANVADRISLYHRLGPLGFSDTRRMIRFRLARAGAERQDDVLFTLPGMLAIYLSTGGYPRKIIHLCHKAVLAVIIQNRSRAGWRLVRSCARRAPGRPKGAGFRRWAWILTVLAMTAGALAAYGPDLGPLFHPEGVDRSDTAVPPAPVAPASSPKTPARDPLPASAPSVRLADTRRSQPAFPAANDDSRTLAETGGEGNASGNPPADGLGAEKTDRADGMDAGTAPDPPPATRPVAAPELLGTVALQENEILSWLMIKLYGDFNNRLLRQVTRANPGIGDTDNIAAGEPIRLPAVAVEPSRRPDNKCWIELARSDDLNDAIDFIRRYPRRAPAVRILPYWNSVEGLHFSVLLWTRFAGDTEAAAQLAALPPGAATRGRLVHHWNPDDIYFSDPYRVR